MTSLLRTIRFGSILAALWCAPLFAFAHATPIEYSPRSSSTELSAPQEVSIRFSERLEDGASIIRITGPSGADAAVSRAVVDAADPHRLSVMLRDDGPGTYLAAWSVISSDDGHFTRGAYAFAVGEGIVVSADSGSATEVVQIAAKPEAVAMTVELLGNGLILAVLLLFALVFRPLLASGAYDAERLTVVRGYRVFFYSGAAFAIVGACAQLLIKSFELAPLQQLGILDALFVYLQTAAGSASGLRALAVIVAVAIFIVGRNVIAARTRVTSYEWLLVVAMGAFEYFRASVSHATANPFYPEFSVAVNFVHLIEKDLWFGTVAILLALTVLPQLRGLLVGALPRIFAILSVNVGLLAVTGCYIIWLHLKSFENLFSTAWGAAFIALATVAGIAVALRTYHTVARAYRPGMFYKLLPLTLSVECATALLVVYFSSIVIITSPPLLLPHTTTFTATESGLTVELQRNTLRDNELLLTLVGGKLAGDPTVTILGSNSIAVDLEKHFDGGYGFPLAVLAGEGEKEIHIRAPQMGAYDADVTFSIEQSDFVPPADYERRRKIDAFAIVMTLLAASGIGLSYLLLRLSRRAVDEQLPWRFARPLIVPLFLVAIVFIGFAASTAAASPFANPLRALCEQDGNMWHLMQPMRGGVPLSATSREGCMWGMGTYQYLFADAREYKHYRAFPEAVVTLSTEPTQLVAGVPTTLTVSLKDTDGEPAELFVDMEKLVHMVIISEDQTVFSHIHADDLRPLTQQEIETSTFKFAYTFPKAGRYSMALDYAHGLTLSSKQFVVEVDGAPRQQEKASTYPSEGAFAGYAVQAEFGLPIAGEVATAQFTITKDGAPVTTLTPYLSAAMHIAAVKNDLTEFIHTHGEVHPPGIPYPPVRVANGKVVHSMASMQVPARFGPMVDAHLIFPSAGRYTVWAQFMVDGRVIPASFTVDVR